MRSRNGIINQRIAYLQLMQMRHVILLCYLQILRQFLISYGYDNANRLTNIAQTNAAGSNVKNISFTYDSAGNLKTYNDGTTSATYTYDELYRKTQETINYGSFSLTTSYAYDKNGIKKSFTYPNGQTITYTYDANNQITGVNVPYAGNISYDAYQWTRPTNVTLPSASGAKQYAYDELMRTKTITSNDPSDNALMNYQYTYDKMDNIKTRNTQTGNYAYNYDNLYRLNEVKKDDTQTENYTYDQVGNRTTSKATTGDWTYNNNNELLSLPGETGQSSPTNYQYDANGNTIQRSINGQVQNFVYDVDNRLIEVKDASNNTIAKYTYDPFGRRIKKEIPSPLAGEGVIYYHYSDEGLIGEYDNTGNQLRIYGYKPDSTWSTDPLFMREGGNIYFYHNDHLGTPQKMTNISGETVWSASYDAFGKATVDASSTITNNLRFPGQYFDAETGWHWNWNRYYDSSTGRYVTEDPIGLAGGVNLFTYVLNSPLHYLDPEGLWGYDVHYVMTLEVAKELKYDEKCAIKIAKKDQTVDEDERDPFGPDHKISKALKDPRAIQNRRDWHFTTEQRRLALWNKAITSCSCYDIGSLLHTVQDSFSHEGYNPKDGHKSLLVDNQTSNWQAAAHTRKATRNYLESILKNCREKLKGSCCEKEK